jgi:hypothetical protein
MQRNCICGKNPLNTATLPISLPPTRIATELEEHTVVNTIAEEMMRASVPASSL